MVYVVDRIYYIKLVDKTEICGSFIKYEKGFYVFFDKLLQCEIPVRSSSIMFAKDVTNEQ